MKLEQRHKISILLCTYNGEKYLNEQLESIASQSYENWTLWISDDGSSDKTIEIIKKFRDSTPQNKVHIQTGPRRGATANFLNLACNPLIQSELYAYADQDDIWLKEKLERAVMALMQTPKTTPGLYCSNSILIDAAGKEIGHPPHIKHPPSFNNALGHIIATGNTMVFNNAAKKILEEAGDNISPDGHDWWTYIAISACGGKVIYDRTPGLKYRLHDNNVAGINRTPTSRINGAINMILNNKLKIANEENIKSIQKISHRLAEQPSKTIETFMLARKSKLITRINLLSKARIRRRTTISDIIYYIAAILNKL